MNDVSTSHKTHLLSTGRLAPVGAEHFTLARTRVLPSLARGITVEYPETRSEPRASRVACWLWAAERALIVLAVGVTSEACPR